MLADKKVCTGCSACYSICKFNAISMQRDEFGFLYPKIDESKCVNCGACKRVCPLSKGTPNHSVENYFLGWNLDEKIRLESSSGGIISAIAETYIAKGWTIFGAVWNEKKKAVCIEDANNDEYKRQRKSKYVEAELGNAFKRVQQILDDGGRVVYVGTPCQVAGLREFLNNRNKDIIYIDFICHGVSSGELLAQHIEMLEKKYRKVVTELNFRGKILGWADYVMELTLNHKIRKYRYAKIDSYYAGFLANCTLKECCYFCKWRKEFAGDITVGDFWGIDTFKKELNDDKGISIVCIKNEKGKEIFENIKPLIYWNEIPHDSAKYIYNDTFADGDYYKKRQAFFDKVNEMGFEKAADNTYMQSSIISYLRYMVKRLLRLFKIRYR